MSGKNIRKLQVIDPSVLKSLLEQLNANTKRQTLANIISESGMNEIIYDYDRYVEAPENSELKETLKDNLYSRIHQYKNKKRKTTNETAPEVQNNDVGNADAGTSGEGAGTSGIQLLQTKNLKLFAKRLANKNIKSSSDGFLIDDKGKKTNIPFEYVLNDFGRNIKKKSSFLLSDYQKNRVMSILGNVGFAQYNIPNRQIKLAYGTNQPSLRKYIIGKTSPSKTKLKRIKKSDEIPWQQIRRKIYDEVSDDD